MLEKVLIEKAAGVTTIIINRAEARNACDQETLALLWDAVQNFEADSAQHAAVLTGAGGAFCAGADLKELSSGKGVGFAWAGADRGLTRHQPSKPVIAAVEGHAVAAGLALAVWCDLRVADETAVFGVFCRRFGVPMTNGAAVRLPRLIGQSRALDMFLTGRPVLAREAYEIGLANRLVPKGTARAAAEQLAREIATFPQICLRSDRTALLRQWDLPEEAAIRVEVELGAQAFRKETQEGARRFATGAGRHGDFS